jgi:hypothetical protein
VKLSVFGMMVKGIDSMQRGVRPLEMLAGRCGSRATGIETGLRAFWLQVSSPGNPALRSPELLQTGCAVDDARMGTFEAALEPEINMNKSLSKK